VAPLKDRVDRFLRREREREEREKMKRRRRRRRDVWGVGCGVWGKYKDVFVYGMQRLS